MKMRYSKKVRYAMRNKTPKNWKRILNAWTENAIIAGVWLLGMAAFLLRIFL